MDAGEPSSLPRRINHPFHEHELVLRPYQGRSRDSARVFCYVCFNPHKEGDEIYACDASSPSHHGCDFVLDPSCSSLKAVVHFRGHKHPLYILERVDPIICKACSGLSGKLTLACVAAGCEFGLHLPCGPWPVAIPYHYAGYDMTLILKDTLLDGVDPEDSWCDICEEARDPSMCVYRSEDPPFTAAIDCLLPQIVGALQGHLGEVQVRSVGQHVPGVVQPVTAQYLRTLQRLAGWQSLHDDDDDGDGDDDDDAEGATEEREMETQAVKEPLTQDDYERIHHMHDHGIMFEVRHYKFSDHAAFELFNKYVNINGEFRLYIITPWLEEETHFVEVGDNSVLLALAPLYRRLIDKHGDFTADSPLSPSGRAVCLLEFLKMVHNMLGLQVHFIEDDYLPSWQWFLELCRDNFGFSLQFALDNLEKVARAYYALELVKVRDNINVDLTQQIEKLAIEIDVDKPRIESLRCQYGKAKKESAFVRQCLADPSKLQWKDAGEFLGLDPEE